MSLFKISPAFKAELRQQRHIIFGNKRYIFHLIMWAIALGYLAIGVFGDDFNAGFKIGTNLDRSSQSSINSAAIAETPFIFVSFISALIGGLMVYIYLLYFVPLAHYKKQRRFLWFGVILNFGLWFMAIILSGIILGLKHDPKAPLANNDSLLISMLSSVFAGIIAGVFFSLYYFLDLYDQQKNLNQYRRILTEKLEAETNFLKTQINPHFLFNTLNNIYSLTLSQSADAALITRQLKDLITYMLYDCTQDVVSLSGEINFLKNYISLEQLRNKQEQIDIQLVIKGETGDKKIAPLLLVNFVENAFKHGVKAGISNAFVRINLLIMDNILALEMVNSKPQQTTDHSKSIKEDGGIGIKNVKRRLNILYPERHKLRISESPKDYSVYLTINL